MISIPHDPTGFIYVAIGSHGAIQFRRAWITWKGADRFNALVEHMTASPLTLYRGNEGVTWCRTEHLDAFKVAIALAYTVQKDPV